MGAKNYSTRNIQKTFDLPDQLKKLECLCQIYGNSLYTPLLFQHVCALKLCGGSESSPSLIAGLFLLKKVECLV